MKPTLGSENIFISDKEAHVILKVRLDGKKEIISGEVGVPGNNMSEQVTNEEAKLNEPMGIDCDENGNIYVANFGINQIVRVGIDGTTVRISGNEYGIGGKV